MRLDMREAVCETWPGVHLVGTFSSSMGLGGAERSPPEGGGLYCGPEWT